MRISVIINCDSDTLCINHYYSTKFPMRYNIHINIYIYIYLLQYILLHVFISVYQSEKLAISRNWGECKIFRKA